MGKIGDKRDRRTLKTESAIKEAFISLLKEKRFETITVKELTDRADIHRATFYDHYEDIYNLYRVMVGDILDDIADIYAKKQPNTYYEFYSEIIDYISQRLELARHVFINSRVDHNTTMLYEITSYLVDMTKRLWMNEYGIEEINLKLEYQAYYRVYGIIALVGHWISSDYSMPAEDLKKLIADMDKNTDRFIIK